MNKRIALWPVLGLLALGLAALQSACSSLDEPIPPPKVLTCLNIPNTDFSRHACQTQATAGNASAMAFLGDYYAGRNDYPTAFEWYRKAADAGDSEVLRRLFDGYNTGQRIPQSQTLAHKYAQMALAARQPWARLYAAHEREGKDPMGAKAEYVALAQDGNCFAQARLARAYYWGDLGPRSPAYAYYWASLATAGGLDRSSDYDPDTDLFNDGRGKPLFALTCADMKHAVPLDAIAQTLPPSALRLAQDSAALWQPGQPEPDLPLVPLMPLMPMVPIPQSPIATASPTAPMAEIIPPNAAYPTLNANAIVGRPASDTLALIIGIDGYESAPRALYADNDAQSVQSFALHVMGIAPDHIRLMIGRAARRLDIEKALITWLPPRIIPGKTNILVFFAGHGMAAPNGNAPYLLPYDGDPDLLEQSAFRTDALIRRLAALKAGAVTLIIDACYSGQTRGGGSLTPQARPIVLTAKPIDVPGTVSILTAADNTQIARALGPAAHGLFTYEMLMGLEGPADLDGDHRITVAELFRYAHDRVAREASAMGTLQTPVLAGDGAMVLAQW